MNKTISYFLVGVIGAMLLGLLSSFFLTDYGANSCDQPPDSTCDCFCCHLFNSRGYESCSQFGLYAGALIGAILGVLAYRAYLRKRKRRKRTVQH